VSTSPEVLVAEPESIAARQAALRALLERLGTGPTEGLGPVHPFFGPLTRRQWGVLVHKHADPHLRQFGV
jgi:hypothetical protein